MPGTSNSLPIRSSPQPTYQPDLPDLILLISTQAIRTDFFQLSSSYVDVP